MNTRPEGDFLALPNVTPEQATEMFGPIPDVVTSITISESQVPEAYGHVPGYEQEKIYFLEMMRIMEARGVGFQALMDKNVFASLGEYSASLARDLKVGDQIEITTRTKEMDRQVLFEQEMERAGKHVSKHEMVINLRGRAKTMIPIPSWVSERLRSDINPPVIDSDIISE